MRVLTEGVVGAMNSCRCLVQLHPGCVVNLDRRMHERTEVVVTLVVLFARNDYWLRVLDCNTGRFYYFERDSAWRYNYADAPDTELDRAILAAHEKTCQ